MSMGTPGYELYRERNLEVAQLEATKDGLAAADELIAGLRRELSVPAPSEPSREEQFAEAVWLEREREAAEGIAPAASGDEEHEDCTCERNGRIVDNMCPWHGSGEEPAPREGGIMSPGAWTLMNDVLLTLVKGLLASAAAELLLMWLRKKPAARSWRYYGFLMFLSGLVWFVPSLEFWRQTLLLSACFLVTNMVIPPLEAPRGP